MNKKHGDDEDGKNVNKSEYYKFYLNNAQKAINLMIAQHKSHGNLMQPMPSSKDGVSRHHNFEVGSSTGNLSYEGEAGAQKNLLANRKRDRELTAQAYQADLKGARGNSKKPVGGLAGAEMRKN